jgi:hypothetical protein
MMAATTLENVIVVKSTTGKIYKIDRVAKIVKIFIDETQYGLDNAVGQLPMSEFQEIFEFVRDVSS